MAQTTINVRMDEALKKQLELLCSELGMSISTAVTIFAKTAVRERGIPFELRVPPPNPPIALEEMSDEELDLKIQSGFLAVAEGRKRPAKDVFTDMEKKYSI
ncbi:MAG: type II toxin-antitoxin system RelB/DinJ family antitoxin [Oscillospiraceae bacterium]|nr:type II toxin-antitoxin system RelB/DinJ family antitoxin [Oscillospiraceae bacterium]